MIDTMRAIFRYIYKLFFRDVNVEIGDSDVATVVSVWCLPKTSMAVLRKYGWKGFLRKARSYVRIVLTNLVKRPGWLMLKIIYEDGYESWIRKNEQHDKNLIDSEIRAFTLKPKISVIVPVHNVDPIWLNKCVLSVIRQHYQNWELCMYDDASTNKETLRALRKWANFDKRIRVHYGKDNKNISLASNAAISFATGEFIAFLDDDDELSPNAFFEIAKAVNFNPNLDFIYSDEDKITTTGRRTEPFFKPEWSPDLLLSMNYTCHLSVFRKDVIDRIGGLRQGYEGAQDYDLTLRVAESIPSGNIHHVPKILYHWRKIPGSTSERFANKSYADEAARSAIEDHLSNNSEPASVSYGIFPGTYRVKREIRLREKVSIIIPFRDQADVLKKCVESVLRKTLYENIEIILVDNQSTKPETAEYLTHVSSLPQVKVIQFDAPFNFSAINNFAVSKAEGKYVLFLNNDTEVLSEGWLDAMLEHAQRDEIGVVGAKLLYPNDTLQHAGVVMGMGIAGHAFKYFPAETTGYFSFPGVIRNYSAVTGACALLRKDLFELVGGFDEKNLAVAYNDVDLCLKLLKKGYRNIYTPYAVLYHYESLSRGSDEDLKHSNPEKFARVVSERRYMSQKWHEYIEGDPYYSPNLTRMREDFGIRHER